MSKRTEFTIDLILNAQDKSKAIDNMVDSVKDLIASTDKASNGFKNFNTAIKYLSQIDRELSKLKKQDVNLYNQIFGDVDKDLQKQLQNIFNIDDTVLNNVGSLKDKLKNATDVGDLKKIAKDVNTLYESLGKQAPIDIDIDLSGNGNFDKKVKFIESSLNDANVLFDGFKNNLNHLFDGVGGNAGKNNAVDNVKQQVEELKKSKNKLDKELKVVSNSDTQIAAPKGMANSKTQIKTLEDVIAAYNKAKIAKESFETHNNTNNDDYLKSVANYIIAAKQLKSAFDVEDISDKASFFINEEDNYNAYLRAENDLENFYTKQKDTINKIKALYQGDIGKIDTQITGLQNNNTSDNEKLTASYDTIVAKIKEYNAALDGSDGDTYKIEEEISKLANASAEAKQSLEQVLSDFSFGDFDENTAVNKICDILSIDIPQSADKAQNALKEVAQTANDQLTQSLTSAFSKANKLQQDVVSGTATGKETMNLVGANGIVSSIQGKDYAVEAKTLVGQMLSNLNDNIVMSLHDHPNAVDAFTPSDIEAFAKQYYGQGTKLNGIIANGVIKTIDFNGISQDVAIKISQSYFDNLSQAAQEYSNIFSFDNGNIVPTKAVEQLSTTDPAKYEMIMNQLVDLANASLNDAFAKNGLESTVQDFTKSQIPELSQYISDLQNNSQNALAPVEKLQNLITSMHPDTTIDWSKYNSDLTRFANGEADALTVFNNITKDLNTDNTKSSVTEHEKNTEAIKQENIVQQELNNTKQQNGAVKADVSTVAEHESNTQAIKQEVEAQQELVSAQQKMQDFFDLTKEIQSYDSLDASQIGDFQVKLALADQTLQSMHQNGLLTAEDMDKITTAGASAVDKINQLYESNAAHENNLYDQIAGSEIKANAWKDQAIDAEEKLMNAEEEAQKLKSELTEIKAISQDAIDGSQYKSQLEMAESEIEKLKSELTQLSSNEIDASQYKTQLEDANNEVKRLATELVDVNNKLKDMSANSADPAQLNTALLKVDELENSLTEAHAQIQKMSTQDVVDTESIKSGKSQLEEFKKLAGEIMSTDIMSDADINQFTQQINEAGQAFKELFSNKNISAKQMQEYMSVAGKAKAQLVQLQNNNIKQQWKAEAEAVDPNESKKQQAAAKADANIQKQTAKEKMYAAVEAAKAQQQAAAVKSEAVKAEAKAEAEAQNQADKAKSRKKTTTTKVTSGTNTDTTQASAELDSIITKAQAVESALREKTAAINEMSASVQNTAMEEANALQKLVDKIEAITASVREAKQAMVDMGSAADQTDVKSEEVVPQTTTSQPTVESTASVTYALESTLQQTNNILTSVLNAIGSNDSTAKIEGLLNTIIGKLNGLSTNNAKSANNTQSKKNGTSSTPTDNNSNNKSKDVSSKSYQKQKDEAVSGLAAYKKEVESSIYKTDEFINRINDLEKQLSSVRGREDLASFNSEFSKFQSDFSAHTKSSIDTQVKSMQDIKKELKSAFNSTGIDLTSNNLDAKQQEVVNGYKQISSEIDMCIAKARNGEQVQTASLNSIKQGLLENIHAYKQENDLLDSNARSGAKYGSSAVIRERARYDSLLARQNDPGDSFSQSASFSSAFEKYQASYQKLINLRTEISTKSFLTGEDIAQFESAKKECAAYGRELEKVIQISDKLQRNSEASTILGDDFEDTQIGRRKALTDFIESTYGVTPALEDFKKNYNECIFAIDNGDGTLTKMSASFDFARHSIVSTAGDTQKATTMFGRFADMVKTKFQTVGSYLISSVSFYEVWNVLRQGVTSVKEIDTALTELKKVTNETDAVYNNFLKDASKTASVIGSTVSELTTMTAEWARLGYTIQESAKLAESTGVLLNVSEFEDATDASEALISTMQAFQYTADESMSVVDILNEVGNNYAVSSDGIATALQTSASALYAAGNDMEQSVAMVAAANKVIQDPSQVGSALRTISLRLRGTSVKEMEAAGEDTEGLVSQSKMRDKILSLAGVDILTDTGAYKDTYTIITEIAKVWNDMSNMDQAALLELMAGKNRSNAMAALLTNLDDLEGAYQSAQQAEGSAYRENQTYLDSIQGRMDLFTNSVQTFWMNLLSSNMIKGVVDLGTTLVNILDTTEGKIASIGITFATIFKFKNKTTFADMFTGMYKSAKDNISAIRGLFSQTFTGSGTSQVSGSQLFNVLEKNNVGPNATKQIEGIKGLTAQTAILTEAQKAAAQSALEESMAHGNLSKEAYTCSVAQAGLASAETVAALGGEKLAVVTMKNVVADGQLSRSRAAATLVTMGLGQAHMKAVLGAEMLSVEEIKAALATKELSVSEALAIMVTEGFSAEQMKAAFSSDAQAVSATAAAVASGELSVAQGLAALSTMGLSTAANVAKVALSGLWAVIKANPVMVIGAAALLAGQAIDKFSNTAEKAAEASQDAFDGISSSVQNTESALQSAQSELDEINKSIAELSGTNLTFTDEQELQRLKKQRETLRNTADDQEAMLEQQQKSQADVARTAMTDFLKSSSYGTEEAKKSGKKVGTALGVAAGIAIVAGLTVATGGAALPVILSTTGLAAGVGGGYLGSKVGENAGAKSVENQGTYDAWYQTYMTPLEEKQKAAEEARQAYLKDSSNMELYDAWQEKQQEISDIQSEMQNQLAQAQQYYSGIDYGISPEMDKELDRYYDFLDRINIESNTTNAKKNALDRLLGENASQEIKDFKKQVDDAFDEGKELDIEIPPELVARLEDMGMSVEDLENYLAKVGEVGVGAFDDLSNALNDAQTAADNLNDSLSSESNGGYETRDKAIDEMQRLIDKGLVGSESNLWNIAEKYGFTYKSAKTIEENTTALQNFINARKKWYQVDDDGDITVAGVDAFARAMDSAVNNNKELQEEGIKWNYSDDGTLEFDFNNMNLDNIIEQLSKTKELSGITTEEFMDMLTALGQFVDINWSGGNDIISWLDAMSKGGSSLTEQLEGIQDPLQSLLSSNGLGSDTIQKWMDDGMSFDKLKETDAFKKLSEDIQDAIERYKELQEAINGSNYVDTGIDGATGENKSETALDNLKNNDRLNYEQNDVINSIKIDVSDLDTKKEKIDALNESIDNIKELRKMNLDSDSAEQAKILLEEVIRRKQKLSEPTIMNVSTTKADADIQNAILIIQQYVQARNDLEVAKELGLDTTDAQAKVTELGTQISDLTPEVKAKIGLKEGSTEDLLEQINAINPENIKGIRVKATVNDAEVQSYEAGEKGSKVNYTVNDDAVEEWRAKNHDVNAKVKYTADTTNLNTPSGSGGRPGVNGTAHARGNWGAKETETALVGELGPEIIVRGDRWFTVGDNGAEFTDIQKGDIIFNHKQSAGLLSNGYVTSRGKAYAEGTAYANSKSSLKTTKKKTAKKKTTKKKTTKKSTSTNPYMSAVSKKDAVVLDWIEIRIDEINKKIDLMGAKLKNAVGLSNVKGTGKLDILDEMIKQTNDEIEILQKGSKKYQQYADAALSKVPKKYREQAKDGSVAISTFGKKGSKTRDAVENYRKWAEKAANAQLEVENKIAERTELAVQKLDVIASSYDAKIGLVDTRIDNSQASADLQAEKGNIPGDAYYDAIIKQEKEKQKLLQDKRQAMQEEFDKQVKAGNIKEGSDEWYKKVAEMNALDKEITESQIRVEKAENTKLENNWKRFQEHIDAYDRISSEAQQLIDVIGEEKLVNDDGTFTKEGITTIGLYAQQMEIAQKRAAQYQSQIDQLNKDYAAGKYSASEYAEKLEELKNGQYESIQAYNDAKNAIVDLEKARVDEIKNGIDEEIDAYSELIEKKKEALNADKDLYDFQKNTMKQQKDIAKIQRKLAALANDNSASAIAERKKLEAELAEAQADLQESYYERSVSDQETALDKELEDFQEEKEKEKEQWDDYLEDVDTIIKNSIDLAQTHADEVLGTINEFASNYNLTITDSLTNPWKEGEKAIDDYSKKFSDFKESATDLELGKVDDELDKTHQDEEDEAKHTIGDQDKEYEKLTSTTTKKNTTTTKKKTTTTKKQSLPYGKVSSVSAVLKYGSKGNSVKALQYALRQLGYNSVAIDGSFGPKTLAAVKNFQKKMGLTQDGMVGPKTKAKFKAKGYAVGTTGITKDQLAWIDEFGEELVIRPDGNGKLSYLTKGTSVIPADLTENLMAWGEIDPQAMLDRSRPKIGASKSVINNTIELSMDIGEVVHIDTVTNDTIPDLTKAVEKQMDSYMAKVNNALKRYSR